MECRVRVGIEGNTHGQIPTFSGNIGNVPLNSSESKKIQKDMLDILGNPCFFGPSEGFSLGSLHGPMFKNFRTWYLRQHLPGPNSNRKQRARHQKAQQDSKGWVLCILNQP